MNRFPRLHEAVDYAAEVHRDQPRKGTDIAYLSHLLAVSALVMEFAGEERADRLEDMAVAGLLHDVIEDGGEHHRADVRRRFGDRVADIVEGCTDGIPDEAGRKPPWKGRKESYLHHLRGASHETVVVSACDKLHNARSIAAEIRHKGVDAVFAKFNASREETLWYYSKLLKIYARRLGEDSPLVIELRHAIEAMHIEA